MKILVINPNISESVTALIAAEARRAASPGTVIVPATAPFGVAYIETESEAAVGAYAAMILYAEHGIDCDAVVIAAFGDPGLLAVREIAPVPVVGIAEAAFVAAGELGTRFSIVAISQRIAAWYRRCAQLNEVKGNLASIRTLTGPIGNIGAVQEEQEVALLSLCTDIIDQDSAQAIILAGAPLAGLGRRIADRLPVPLVDGVTSGVRLAEARARIRAEAGAQSRAAGGYAPPPEKPHKGLPPALAALVGRRRTG